MSVHEPPAEADYVNWAVGRFISHSADLFQIKFAENDHRDLKKYLFHLEEDILIAEYQLCGM